MTDITTGDIRASGTCHQTGLPRLGFPRLSLGATLGEISTTFGQAFAMAYVAPYQASLGRPVAPPDPELQGRDPNW